MPIAKGRKGEGYASAFLHRPQGAPRGLLLFYMLHRIALKPAHGYEISQDIEEKTGGAWRPAPGSIYPMLKKLVSAGLIRTVPGSSLRGAQRLETAQHVYEITPKGLKCSQEWKERFANAPQNWAAMRRIFTDLMDKDQLSNFLVESSKQGFDLFRETIDSKLSEFSQSDAEFVLKEYHLNLERQLNWTESKLLELNKKEAVVSTTVKTTR